MNEDLNRGDKPSLHEHENEDGHDDKQAAQPVVHADNTLIVDHGADWQRERAA